MTNWPITFYEIDGRRDIPVFPSGAKPEQLHYIRYLTCVVEGKCYFYGFYPKLETNEIAREKFIEHLNAL